MELNAITIIALLIALIAGIAIGMSLLNTYQTRTGRNRRLLAEEEARSVVNQANETAAEIIRQGEERIRILQTETEDTLLRRRRDLDKEEERLQRRREDVDNRYERSERREQNLNKRQSALDKKENDTSKLEAQRMQELERIGQMTVDEAREVLLVMYRNMIERKGYSPEAARELLRSTEPFHAFPALIDGLPDSLKE